MAAAPSANMLRGRASHALAVNKVIAQTVITGKVHFLKTLTFSNVNLCTFKLQIRKSIFPALGKVF